MIQEKRIVDAFIDYVKIDSPTKSELEFSLYIKSVLENIGFEVFIDKAGHYCGSNTGNVIAKMAGNIDKEAILFSCHMDTVSPSIGIKPIIKDGTIYSDGTTILGGDNKAGIAAVIEAVQVIKENNLDHGPIEVVFSIYEEGGLHGAKNLDYSLFASKKAFVLDSGGDPGQIIIQGPAQDKINVKITGKPAHAGVAPEEGISAIMVASEAISKMRLLRIDEETTANIGTIEGGGATNIVTPEVMVRAEARSLSNDKLDRQSQHMVACFQDAAQKYGAKIDAQVERMYGAFEVSSDDPIVDHVKKACDKIGLKAFTDTTGGGSDTNVLNANGIKAVNLGIGERKPHTLEEHLHIVDLVNAARLVLAIIEL